MAVEIFSDNLLRMIAAELHFLCGMTAAREMYGKSYFSLGVSEKAVVDQTVTAFVATNYQSVMTPEGLRSQTTVQPVGFRAHEQQKPPGTS
jgi:hypothetical protein